MRLDELIRGYLLDWTSRFTALAESVHLDRTPLPGEPQGKIWGGYAGLSLRLAQLDERAAVNTEGPLTFNDQQRSRSPSSAFEYDGELGGQAIGIAVLDHEQNLESRSPWYAIRSGSMSFFTPAVLCYSPHEMVRFRSRRPAARAP